MNDVHMLQALLPCLVQQVKKGAQGGRQRGKLNGALILEFNLVGNAVDWQFVFKRDQVTSLYITEESITVDGRLAGIFKLGVAVRSYFDTEYGDGTIEIVADSGWPSAGPRNSILSSSSRSICAATMLPLPSM